MTVNDIDAGKCGDPKSLRRRIAEVIAPGSFGSSPVDYGWQDDEDGWFRFSNTDTFLIRVAALNQADRVIKSFPQIVIEKNHPYEDVIAAIMFTTEHAAYRDDGVWFLHLWTHGDWDKIDIEFPAWRWFLKGSGVNVDG
jgi:hypothetical protein